MKRINNSEKFMPTFILVGINVAFYIYTSLIGGNFLNTNPEMIYRFGQVNGLVIYGGLYYQILTSIFVHGNIAHLFGNMLFLLIFGLRAEEFFTLPEYFFIFFLGGLTGNLLSLVLLPLDLPSVGASGAVFAIFGAATIYARQTVSQSIVGALLYALFLLFLSSGPNVNNFAHIGGLFTGLVIGYVLAVRRSKKTNYLISYSY
jgi:rhomboid protease GluP